MASKLAVICYGFGDLASQFVWTFVGSYLTIYYTDIVGLAPAIVSVIMMGARIWDAINDPMMGAIAERTRSKFGRFRPYIAFGCPFLAIFAVLTFTNPFGGGSAAGAIWAAVTYIIAGMLYTLVNIPYAALSGVMTEDANQRNKINTSRNIGMNLGMVIVNALSAGLALRFSGEGAEVANGHGYPNTMDADLDKRTAAVEHLKKLICASAKLGVNMVTTFIGRDQTKTVEQNLELVREVWPPIIALAEAKGVKIAIENCPMLFGADQWPGGQNLMTTPAIWRKVFEILPSANLGLNYDPSHFVWQMIDYIQPLYEFKDKIFHVHYKDIKVYPDRLQQVGIMGYPLDFMSPKLPGLGDVNWGKYVSALTDIGYQGYTCIEIEDKAFEGSVEDVKKSVLLSTKYLRNYVI